MFIIINTIINVHFIIIEVYSIFSLIKLLLLNIIK